MITAQILADSINSRERRITTWLLEYPRFIHAEFMTHRDFSRNAGSSRAIPLKESIFAINKNPALPVWWGSTQKGMQSGPELTGENLVTAKSNCDRAMRYCIDQAWHTNEIGLHKSITNRWLEPWSHIKVIATITDMRNFFALRAHPAAMPEFQVLAYRMLELYLESIPTEKKDGEWHIPFEKGFKIDPILTLPQRLKVATARCCWVSYNKPDKVIGEHTTVGEALARHDDAAKNGHWSPFEHCARAVPIGQVYAHSNFDTDNYPSGWFQYRKGFNQERKTKVNLQDILNERPEWTKTAGL